jgi:hypothetical protein
MAGSQGSGRNRFLVVGVVESPPQYGGLIIGTVQLAGVDSRPQLSNWVGAGGGEQQQAAPQGWPGGLVGHAGHGLLGRVFQGREGLCSGEILCGDMECVGVAPRGFAEPRSWVVLIMVECRR